MCSALRDLNVWTHGCLQLYSMLHSDAVSNLHRPEVICKIQTPNVQVQVEDVRWYGVHCVAIMTQLVRSFLRCSNDNMAQCCSANALPGMVAAAPIAIVGAVTR